MLEWSVGHGEARIGSRGPGDAGAAAAAAAGWLVVSEEYGGHGVAWLGSRIVARGVLARAGIAPASAERAGAAADVADGARWMAGDAERADEADTVLAAERQGSTPSPAALLLELDGTLRAHRVAFATSCTVARVTEDQVVGAHVGASGAWVIREGRMEALTVAHDLETVDRRRGRLRAGVSYPPNVVANGLGTLEHFGVSVDELRTTLGVGDVLLLSSRPLDDMHAERLAAWAHEPLSELVHRIEITTPRAAFALARRR